MADFGLSLLRECGGGEENALLSPLSILSALGMTANGAGGDTLSQMETAFGLPASELNAAISAVQPEEENSPLSGANAIWFNDRDGLAVNHDFLQANADWYGAGIYSEPFGADTCDEINRWVSDKTKGMIPKILDQVPGDAVMYLVNALAFDARMERSLRLLRPPWRGPSPGRTGPPRLWTDARRGVRLSGGEKPSRAFVKDYQDRSYALWPCCPRKASL